MPANQSSIESLLIRLNIPEAIEKFREMKIDRIFLVRDLTEEQLREAVPDDAKRKTLQDAILSRGNYQARPQGPQERQQPPPRSVDTHLMRGNFDEGRGGNGGGNPPYRDRGFNNNNNNNNMGFGRGRGGGFGGGRGGGGGNFRSGNNNNNNNNSGAMGFGGGGNGMDGGNFRGGEDGGLRICRHYNTPEGCKYGDKCRYVHEEGVVPAVRLGRPPQDALDQPPPPPRVRENLAETYEFSDDCEIPTTSIKFLLAHQGEKLKSIHEYCKTCNERFRNADKDTPTFTLKLYGHSKESVARAKYMIMAFAGVKKEESRKHRFNYAKDELNSNIHAVKYLAACNTRNQGTQLHLSEASLRNIISTFRFASAQTIHHYYTKLSGSEKDRLEVVSKIVSQLNGVQAIVFCDQKHIEDISRMGARYMRYFNNVEPRFMHRKMSKADRMQVLEDFKNGVPNESGIKQRLLFTTDDYAKLARKTVIPYVNLVVNLSFPRLEEFYVLQSHVAGRYGTVGASILFVRMPQDEAAFEKLDGGVTFKEYTGEEVFRDTAMQLTYDTVDHPLTPENAEPPSDWRERLAEEEAKKQAQKKQ